LVVEFSIEISNSNVWIKIFMETLKNKLGVLEYYSGIPIPSLFGAHELCIIFHP
jgi:hypothetical protein